MFVVSVALLSAVTTTSAHYFLIITELQCEVLQNNLVRVKYEFRQNDSCQLGCKTHAWIVPFQVQHNSSRSASRQKSTPLDNAERMAC